MITSKQPKLGLTQELFFSRICESTTCYTFTPCVGSFTWHRHQIERTTGFYCLFRKTQANVGWRNCLRFEKAVGGIEPPSPRLTVRRSTARPPLPTYVIYAYYQNTVGKTFQLNHRYYELIDHARFQWVRFDIAGYLVWCSWVSCMMQLCVLCDAVVCLVWCRCVSCACNWVSYVMQSGVLCDAGECLVWCTWISCVMPLFVFCDAVGCLVWCRWVSCVMQMGVLYDAERCLEWCKWVSCVMQSGVLCGADGCLVWCSCVSCVMPLDILCDVVGCLVWCSWVSSAV